MQDFADRLIIPGLADLHLHAPQYAIRGTGMDLELLEWLNTNAYPEEARYADLDYARLACGQFVQALLAGATTRACVFATVHVPAAILLMELLEESGLITMVGKVNMDRNCPDSLREQSAGRSLADTELWIKETSGRFRNVSPILTPRFIPSCSDELMQGLGRIQRQSKLPLQSHLSENLAEIEWVRSLCPSAINYAEAYEHFGLFGGDCPTVMAHCVHLKEEEIDRINRRGVFIAHCPQSNTNLSSGIAPVRTFIDRGLNVGLGTDIAGGFSLSILRAMSDAVQSSKLRWRLTDDSLPPLTMAEAFYLGTKGGGAFFGRAGSFEPGYEFDAVVLDDKDLPHPQSLTPVQRLERMICLADDRNIMAKYVAGRKIFNKCSR